MKQRFETREDFISAINEKVAKIQKANAILRYSPYIWEETIMDGSPITKKRLVIEWEVINESEEQG